MTYTMYYNEPCGLWCDPETCAVCIKALLNRERS